MTFTVAVVSAGLGQPSSTRLLADRLTESLAGRVRSAGHDVLVEVVELRPLARPLADHLVTGFPGPELEAAVATVTSADALVAVTPVFAASYSGLFKTFFDVLDHDALAGKPTLVAATAGTARHSLVLEHALRPLFSHLRAVVVPTAVFAATEDFGDTSAGRLGERVDRAAAELVALLVPASRGAAPATAGEGAPEPGFGTSRDGFDDVVPFEQLLRGTTRPGRHTN
jgi:FMN reductase